MSKLYPESKLSDFDRSVPSAPIRKRSRSLVLKERSVLSSVPIYWLLAVSYTHLRAHETVLDLVCRLQLEKKKKKNSETLIEATHTDILLNTEM